MNGVGSGISLARKSPPENILTEAVFGAAPDLIKFFGGQNAAISELLKCGLPSDEVYAIREDLTVALMWPTFVHENSSRLPGMTIGILQSLQFVGRTFARKQAALAAFESFGGDDSHAFFRYLANAMEMFTSWGHKLEWVADSAVLGKGEDRARLTAGMSEALLFQLVGLLVVHGRAGIADRMLQPWLSAATARRSEISGPDPQDVLRSLISPFPEESSESSGPDHQRTYLISLRSSEGLTATGKGPSKKKARRNACENFLELHFPDALSDTVRPGRDRPNMIEESENRSHASTARRICQLFQVDREFEGLIGQALIHSSWASEDRVLLWKARQRDNRMLSLVGDVILEHEYVVAIVQDSWRNPQSKLSIVNIADEQYASAFAVCGVEEGVLLGNSVKSDGYGRKVQSKLFKALAAALCLATGGNRLLQLEWPSQWSDALQLFAPGTPTPLDPTTVLEKTLQSVGMRWHWRVNCSGNKGSEKQVEIDLFSDVLKKEVSLGGPPFGGRWADGKHLVSCRILEGMPTESNSTTSGPAGRSSEDSIQVVSSFFQDHLNALVQVDEKAMQGEFDLKDGLASAQSQRGGQHRRYDYIVTEAYSVDGSRGASGARSLASSFSKIRREAALVRRYVDWLVGVKGGVVPRHRIQVPGSSSLLFTDLFDVSTYELVEAKSSASRNHLRLAIGQLFDYRRFVHCKRLAVLVPVRPEEDLCILLHDVGVSVIFETDPGVFSRLSAT
ncbi:hypothetical protein E1091_00840 [Micromonospora fluostatini]|uniref:DRBM domain-containing protein n=1 Tax=Micromonospora fluostatini TaxID=1629071 RepID=A0ABY2DLW6_9ACTN|nr:hypothetical protein E1091_00840 [Micromonospora fluostatini]